MALRAHPHRPIQSPHRPLHGNRRARSHPNAVLQSLSNMAGQSGGTPPAAGGGAGGGAAGGGQAGPEAPWESDPVLQQIRQLQAANVATADAQAQAARQQALINFGYSAQLDPLYGDAGTKGSAQANPFSVLAELGHGHELRQRGLNSSYNKANLFYSSARGQGLAAEGRQYLGEQASATQKLQAMLSGISQDEASAHQQSQGAVTSGMQDAYQRFLDQQMQYGLGGSAGGAQQGGASGGGAQGGAQQHAGGVLHRLGRRQRGARHSGRHMGRGF